ncbi:TIR domain-containing protein [Natranaerovirga hydrolytica]|uniref:TIR domain-containing protein n=1 Tax=Natranaerovirga hydrolytica TaxID=680378 RepID=UPI00104903F0|nr:toll/interleukin-1 receptor domain-containing protein [Natranaerovirga hydrolytica]
MRQQADRLLASEDKDILVRPLAKQLSEVYKVHIWYDEFSLEYGDSLLDSIEKGLQDSKYGVVIFSKAFFEKVWTTHEYKSLKTKEMLLNQKVIIPIWYKISKNEIAQYSLTLADKYAISLNNTIDIDDLAVKIVKIIRPDIYSNLSRMRYVENQIKDSIKATISNEEFKKISLPPIRHKEISIQIKARLKVVHNAIKDVDMRSYQKYEEDFRRSTNIDREIIITELLTAAYLDCIYTREMTKYEKVYIYAFVMSLCNDQDKFPFSKEEISKFISIIDNYIRNIDARVVMEYKFEE